MYQYSLDSFLVFFNKSLQSAAQDEDLTTRVNNLTQSLRITIYTWVSEVSSPQTLIF